MSWAGGALTTGAREANDRQTMATKPNITKVFFIFLSPLPSMYIYFSLFFDIRLVKHSSILASVLIASLF
jgi:hypothetical protein